MSEEVITSLYPNPPLYYKFFTEKNKARFEEWSLTEHGEDELPPDELKFYCPPPVPTGDQYRGYGSVWALTNKMPSLEQSGWRQLYSDEDEKITSRTKIIELHKLLDSLLLNFLELLGTMSVEPSKFYVKIEDLKLLIINMNHLLNTYRSHQTRESLIMLLRKQIEDKQQEILDINKVSSDVKERIAKLVEGDFSSNNEAQKPQSQDENDRAKALNTIRELLSQS